MKPRKMIAKYPGTCEDCGGAFEAGASIFWHGRGRTSHAVRAVCNGPIAAAEAEKARAEATETVEAALYRMASSALAASMGPEDAEVENAWHECEGHNPWGYDESGDPGAALRIWYAIYGPNAEIPTHPEDGPDMEWLGCMAESLVEAAEAAHAAAAMVRRPS